MTTFYDVLADGADPGANLGRTFTASLTETTIPVKGTYIDHMLIGVKGVVTTAAVAIETFAGLVTPFTFKVGQETRIQLRLRDLIAVMAWYYGDTPLMWENTDATGSDFILGIKVPIQETVNKDQTYTWSATRVAQTNISSEEFALQAVYNSNPKAKKPIVAVELPYTTAAASGYTQLGVQVPPLGKIIGLMIFNTAFPNDGSGTFSIQRVQILEDGASTSKLLGATSGFLGSSASDATLTPINDLLSPYQVWDFRDDPIDAVGKAITFSVDVETTSSATRLIAIMEKSA
jgi:hypothetical protein